VKRVVIVGGGIAGLSCAYELRQAGAAVTVVEKDRLGGVIRTERVGEYLIEGGPDSFLTTTKPWARELCLELGLENELITPASRKVFVFSGGRLHELPEGVFLTVPTKWWPFMMSGLFSFGGKLRMAMDLFLPRGPEVEDESIGSFIRRRLGAEALEKLAEPIMAGIHVAPADELSLRSTFPRFAELEREHRSLIKGLKKMPMSSGNISPFMTLKGGLSTLVDRIVNRLSGVTFITGKEARGIEPGERTAQGPTWTVHLEDGPIVADAVVLAVPAAAAAKIKPGVPAVKYVSTTTVSLGYKKFRDLDGTGFVIPKGEGRKILACTWTSSKFEGRAPADHVLVRCFVAGTGEEAASIAHEEMKAILGVTEDPVVSRAFAWPERNPVYSVGHDRRIQEFDATLPAGMFLCGSGFHGTGLPDCIRDGRAVARKILGGDKHAAHVPGDRRNLRGM
jgi:oxygen-dependent protoporphyrinogen oxidase